MKDIAIFPEYIDQVVIDDSQKKPRYIAVSRSRKHIQLSSSAYILLEKVASGVSFSAIAEEMSTAGKGMITAEQTQQAYEVVIEKIKKIEEQGTIRRRDFWLKYALIPDSYVQFVASRLIWLFHPTVAFSLLSVLIILVAYSYEHGFFRIVLHTNPVMVLSAYLLFLVSLFAHEFGHSSACEKGGLKPSEIGVAVYLFFPVFYSDVSAAWQLSRWKKVRVDVGGVYFQLCVGVIYLLLLIITGLDVFQLAFAMILGSCILSLNPVLKFDGYWVLTDLLNLPNLYQQPAYLFIHFYQVLFLKQRRPLRWSSLTCIFILIYALVKAVFWTYLLAFFVSSVYQDTIAYPALLTKMLAHMQHGNTALFLADLQTLLISTLFVLIWAIGFGRFGVPIMIRLFTKRKSIAVPAPNTGVLS